MLLRKLNRQQKASHGVSLSTLCAVCSTTVCHVGPRAAKMVPFRCGHTYHLTCLQDNVLGREPSADAETAVGADAFLVCPLCRHADAKQRRKASHRV